MMDMRNFATLFYAADIDGMAEAFMCNGCQHRDWREVPGYGAESGFEAVCAHDKNESGNVSDCPLRPEV